MSAPIEGLAARWSDVVRPAGAGEAAAAALFDEIAQAYQAPERHYHDLNHIAHLIGLSAHHAGTLNDRETVDLAIFFHDVIYDPLRADNEERSAELARVRLTGLGLLPARVTTVARYIMATKHVPAAKPPTEQDLAYVLDFDLSILAADRETYGRYVSAIRREYAMVSDEAYRLGRAAVLRGFLARPHIFLTSALRAQWEAAARGNLASELARYG